MRHLFILCIAIAAAACSRNSSGPEPSQVARESSTVATQNPCTSSQTCGVIDSIGFWVRIQSNDGTAGAGGPWSFTFLDKTYTGTGNAEFGFIDVSPANYELRGQFLASSFTVGLGRQGGGKGGVVADSVKSVEGPVSAASSGTCSIGYFIPFGPERGLQHTFKIQFTVARDIQGC